MTVIRTITSPSGYRLVIDSLADKGIAVALKVSIERWKSGALAERLTVYLEPDAVEQLIQTCQAYLNAQVSEVSYG